MKLDLCVPKSRKEIAPGSMDEAQVLSHGTRIVASQLMGRTAGKESQYLC